MQINVWTSDKRGKGNLGWLSTRYSFSFADYFDEKRMGFGRLRVLNDDYFDAGAGFDFHPHKNMEIVTIVLEGALEHKDNMGNQGVIVAGEVQAMSAGSGIVHSEANPSKKVKVHLLQIWVLPKEENIRPRYDQKSFSDSEKKNKLLTVASGFNKKDELYIHQDAEFLLCELDAKKSVEHEVVGKESGLFVFVIDGEIVVEGKMLLKGDDAEIIGAKKVKITALKKSNVLVIEVPM